MNKNKIFLFTFFLFGINSFAQDTLIEYNNYKWKIGGKFIYDKSKTFGGFKGDGYNVYSGGIQVIEKIKTSSFDVESGLYYFSQSNFGYFSSYINGMWNNFFKLHLAYRSLMIPLNLRYNKILYVSGGVYSAYTLDKMIAEKGYENYVDTVNSFNSEFKISNRKLNFGFNIILGLEKQIYKHFNLFIEGRYFQNFTTVYKSDLGTSERFKNLGFATGINYNF